MPLESEQTERKKCDESASNPDYRATHLHGFDSLIRLLDCINLDPFLGMREQELVNNLNLVARSPDGRDSGHRPN